MEISVSLVRLLLLFSATRLCLFTSVTLDIDGGCIMALSDHRVESRSPFVRVNISNAVQLGAVCNDRSPGLLYLSKPTPNYNKWIIFLESGDGCGSVEDCIIRFRERPYLMTSHLYPPVITGTDIFSSDPNTNPDYWYYNFVIIPYCSSDLWLGSGMWDSAEMAKAANKFQFNSTASYNQFAFRGSVLFRTVIGELIRHEGLAAADDVVFCGTSSGGIGVINQAGWLRTSLPPQATMSIILDSSWFINFDNHFLERFGLDFLEEHVKYLSHESCRDSTTFGYPCCVSAACMLSNLPRFGFPDVPVFVVFSLYDVWVLSNALKELETEPRNVQLADGLRMINEYGRVMRTRLNDTSVRAGNMSYFVPSCLQHVYLVTSNMKDTGGLLNSNESSVTGNTGEFKHVVESGTWKSIFVQHNTKSPKVSLQCAIHEWNKQLRRSTSGSQASSSYPVRYIDDCSGIRCNRQCPDTILLNDLDNVELTGWRYIPVVLTLLIACFSVVYKSAMILWKVALLRNYAKFIYDSKHDDRDKDKKMTTFSPSEAIGISCLNLRYSVVVSRQDVAEVKSKRNENEIHLESSDIETELDMEERDTSTQHKLNFPQQLLYSLSCGSSSSSKVHFCLHAADSTGKETPMKTILKGVTSYFNPGQLVAIMGPSGCGKTTFLDLLTGRRRTGIQKGAILVNGRPFNHVQDWYMKNTGYVLQLAVSYYDELTVRENLVMAAYMRLPHPMSQLDRFERVEEVIYQTGLSSLEDTVVGHSTGPGLSGGQKRRLLVAIQLLSQPKAIFLDEPTSGLDATSSMELLEHLRYVTLSGRLVVVTIHQPRLEIYQMFDRILFLCQGQVAYYGSPGEAPSLFLNAYQMAKLEGDAPVVNPTKNPADVLMDMLGNEKCREAILKYYKMTNDQSAIRTAVKMCGMNDGSNENFEPSNANTDSGRLNRLCVLETRAAMRSSPVQRFFLPFVLLALSLVAGSAYFQTTEVWLLLPAFTIITATNSFLVFPAVNYHLTKALPIYSLERDDGVGKSYELLFQTFVRFVGIAALPITISSIILCLMALLPGSWTFSIFFNVIVFLLTVNQTWTALATLVGCAFPVYGHKLAPLLSCVDGFAGGFLVPPSQMKIYYKWLFYISPTFYGYTGLMRIILPAVEFECDFDSEIECYRFSGAFLLHEGGFENIQPYRGLMMLHVMTILALLLAYIILEWKRGAFSPTSMCSKGKRNVNVDEDENQEMNDEGEEKCLVVNDESTTGTNEYSHTQPTGSQHARDQISSEILQKRLTLVRRHATRFCFVPNKEHHIFKPKLDDGTNCHTRSVSIRDMQRQMVQDRKRRRLESRETMDDLHVMMKEVLQTHEPNIQVTENGTPAANPVATSSCFRRRSFSQSVPPELLEETLLPTEDDSSEETVTEAASETNHPQRAVFVYDI